MPIFIPVETVELNWGLTTRTILDKSKEVDELGANGDEHVDRLNMD